ncbi:hypothetical protein BZG36_02558 [Bifiguratus adelaidae]|uniref:Uncharacterized protein n=1 Tax=Bifiguratus adelaidae TaxID=1938954 RepID=A0A261Y259_9FUNG|nr:hypothetical protein BZG36_02558 [Bifiguratus adelaidae]
MKTPAKRLPGISRKMFQEDYMKTLLEIFGLKKRQNTMVASDSIYQLYNKVMVLYLGRCIFFGPCDRAKAYFMEMGYTCEPRKSIPDFMTSITNPNERIIVESFEEKVPETPEQFERYFLESNDHQVLLQNIAEYEARIGREPAK